jgi:hypothetical protein
MGNLGLTINSEETPPSTFGQPMPKGNYIVQIVESEVVQTNGEKGPGAQVVMKVEVMDGPYKGRTARGRFTLINASEQAQKIGRSDLAGIGVACGKPHYDDTTQVHNIAFEAFIDVDGEWNVFKRANWRKASGGKAAASSAPKTLGIDKDEVPF